MLKVSKMLIAMAPPPALYSEEENQNDPVDPDAPHYEAPPEEPQNEPTEAKVSGKDFSHVIASLLQPYSKRYKPEVIQKVGAFLIQNSRVKSVLRKDPAGGVFLEQTPEFKRSLQAILEKVSGA